MKRFLSSTSVVAAGILLVGGVIAMRARPSDAGDLPPLPEVPQANAIELVEWQPFALEQPGVHTMRAESPSYREGALLVLRSDPENWRLRQGYHNVLYVGAETATRINVGLGSGYLVVIVPGPLELSSAPIFLGDPELPERITKADAQRQLALAAQTGVRPVGDALANVPTHPLLTAEDEWAVYQRAAAFVERYAPDERDLLKTLRAERLRRR